MEKVRGIFAAAILLLMGACASQPPTSAEIALMESALKPSSHAAAEGAVVRYMAKTLKDPESARYTFLYTKMGWLKTGGLRRFGWFLCGTVNGKNSYGAYTGPRTFLAYFDPQAIDVVQDAAWDDGKYPIVTNWCRGIYGS